MSVVFEVAIQRSHYRQRLLMVISTQRIRTHATLLCEFVSGCGLVNRGIACYHPLINKGKRFANSQPRDGPYLCVFKREAGQEAYYTVVEAPEVRFTMTLLDCLTLC